MSVSETDLSLGCFGKLPFWPEFLEVDMARPPARSLRRWIRLGRELAVEAGEADATDGRPVVDETLAAGRHLRILLRVPGSNDVLVGVMRPSRDSGGRPFPFTVFAHVDRRPWRRSWSLLPLALAPVWDALDEAWQSLEEVTNETAFRERLAALRVPSPEPSARVRGEFHRLGTDSASGFLARVGTDGVDHGVRRIVAAWRGGEDAAVAEGPGVRLPVGVDGETACFETGWWIELAGRQSFFRRPAPSVFLDGATDGAGRHVVLRFGAPRPDEYAAIVRPATAPRDDGRAVVEEPETTYAALLGRRHAR